MPATPAGELTCTCEMPAGLNRYICMRPAEPSAGVLMLALLVPLKSWASERMASLPNPPRPKLFVWPLPAASLKPES